MFKDEKARSEYHAAYYQRNKEHRKAYLAGYYDANKAVLKAKRNKQPRTAATLKAEQRYREKRQILKEIEQMQFGPVM